MAVCALIRITGFHFSHYKGVENEVWAVFWNHIEGAVAVMMASLTAFRTLFVKPTSDNTDTVALTPVERLYQRVLQRFRALARAEPGEKPRPAQSTQRFSIRLPSIPSPVFTGIRSFIRKSNRTNGGATTLRSQDTEVDSLDTEVDSLDADYHAFMRS